MLMMFVWSYVAGWEAPPGFHLDHVNVLATMPWGSRICGTQHPTSQGTGDATCTKRSQRALMHGKEMRHIQHTSSGHEDPTKPWETTSIDQRVGEGLQKQYAIMHPRTRMHDCIIACHVLQKLHCIHAARS